MPTDRELTDELRAIQLAQVNADQKIREIDSLLAIAVVGISDAGRHLQQAIDLVRENYGAHDD